MSKLLSICIPTYNKSKELSEIIDAMLSIQRNDLEIVITDNLSTDDTEEKVRGYSDGRVRYCKNTEALPPFINMVHSIFNAQGKYALYCNDRDLLYPEDVLELMHVLEQNELAFLYCKNRSSQVSGALTIYRAGFDSLMHQTCIHHPTGLVFNRELIAQHLHEEDYRQYLKYINTYDFLMLDLLQYGDSAIYDGGYWSARPTEFIKKNKSGTTIYFTPEVRETMFYGVTDRALLENDYSMSEFQKQQVLDKIYLEFCGLFSSYKRCMADVFETAHYGLNRKFISTPQMLGIYRRFFHRSIAHLEEKGYGQEWVQAANGRRRKYYGNVLVRSLKIDVLILQNRLSGR